MIPTSTGAAKAVGEVLPNLIGKLDGSATRVPTANVSLIDFCFQSKRETTSDEINKIIKNASNNQFKNIIQIVDEPMVSVDFNHNPHSSILDAQETKVISNSFCRILSWYDNEWGFSNRLIDVTKELFKNFINSMNFYLISPPFENKNFNEDSFDKITDNIRITYFQIRPKYKDLKEMKNLR